MYGTHQTREGKVIPIIAMETSHIANTLALVAKRYTNELAQSAVKLPKFLQKISGTRVNQKSEDELENLRASVIKVSTSYLLELSRRAMVLKDIDARAAFLAFMHAMGDDLKQNYVGMQTAMTIAAPQDEYDDEDFDDDDEYDYDYSNDLW